MKRQGVFPFTAIIGQEEMKKALILNVVNPRLGGVLIQGEKGTAKSTAFRALADLLPQRECTQACKYHDYRENKTNWSDSCYDLYATRKPPVVFLLMIVVELPVSATYVRIVALLDIELAIREARRRLAT